MKFKSKKWAKTATSEDNKDAFGAPANGSNIGENSPIPKNHDSYDALRELFILHEAGIVDDAEFEVRERELIDELD